MAQATGRVTVVVDGDRLRSKPGASMKFGGEKREGAMTDQNTSYYTETYEIAEVKATMVHMADTDLAKIRKFKNGTVQMETDTGVVYTMPNAFFADMGELKNGEVEVTFQGDPAK